ncbi:hypothetical protein [Pseudomonas caricapapayae]|uniref:hypothetical protein n=1 Tax=Pseudomonas caricapapayae TaxID=46678 RepID=UPI000EFF71B5|nr:hypothetical protein [Pseudomonas caricapapayae]
MKVIVVTTVAIISLQSLAFASTHTQSAPAADGKYALLQNSGNRMARDAKAVPANVASRSSGGLRVNTACDDTGLPCPRG